LYLNKNIILNLVLDGSLKKFCEIEILKDIELPDVLMKIKSYITSHKFKAALKYVLCGRYTFKEESLFQYVVLVNYVCLKTV